MKNQHGFSLLEMAVASLLLGLAAAGLLGLIADSLDAIRTAREYERAVGVAKSTLNEILTQNPPPLGEGIRGIDGGRFAWLARAESVEGFERGAKGDEFLRVRLVVWWDSEGKRKTIALDGYRRSGPR